MIKLNNKFKMTKKEIEQYNLLPDNLPDNKLTKKQIEFVNDLYYNYITLNIDNKINGYELFIGDNREFTKNWYCGKKTTKYQAKRFVLNELVNLNRKYYLKMSNKEALKMLYNSLTCMRHHRILVEWCFKTSEFGKHALNFK